MLFVYLIISSTLFVSENFRRRQFVVMYQDWNMMILVIPVHTGIYTYLQVHTIWQFYLCLLTKLIVLHSRKILVRIWYLFFLLFCILENVYDYIKFIIRLICFDTVFDDLWSVKKDRCPVKSSSSNLFGIREINYLVVCLSEDWNWYLRKWRVRYTNITKLKLLGQNLLTLVIAHELQEVPKSKLHINLSW